MKKMTTLLFIMFSVGTLASDGSSGCGPGWYVLKENSILSSSLRATTNVVLFPTTTIGMTIGTSNCSKHKLVATEKESLHFAVNNFHELKIESARGKGEFLVAFAETIGCKKTTQEKFNSKLKTKHKDIFKNGSGESTLREVYKVILQDRELVQSCSLG